MSKKYISYSDQLARFIEPILDREGEDQESLLFKAQMGMVAWNYCLSQDHDFIPYAKMGATDAYQRAAAQSTKWEKWMKGLVLRKRAKFSQYTNFLVLAEIKDKPDGSQTLYVESAPLEIMMGRLPE
ncbi:MAG: hypothetical protein H6581_31490 [Bacteroidia bacterium]|nr:hypothetical protein [Bacteroidia bacterium]MCB9234125.1 hypothetical protein [Bacteroidia bacterium]MCB9236215.1 hypothetical protein [Bacteroidia bacterium]